MKPAIRLLIFIFISVLSLALLSCTSGSSDGTIEDIDGNSYRTVKIGKQIWMSENLKVTTFNDGEPIPMVTDGSDWHNLKTAAYCWSNNDSASYSDPYGALYNYHTINTGKLCPSGWRVPTQQDFQTLISKLDPDANFVRHEASTIAGGMLKAEETTYWSEPNLDATNRSGFNALPGGCRSWAGNFSMIETTGYYGSSTENTSLSIRSTTGSAFMRSGVSEYVGVSVRCIKEE